MMEIVLLLYISRDQSLGDKLDEDYCCSRRSSLILRRITQELNGQCFADLRGTHGSIFLWGAMRADCRASEIVCTLLHAYMLTIAVRKYCLLSLVYCGICRSQIYPEGTRIAEETRIAGGVWSYSWMDRSLESLDNAFAVEFCIPEICNPLGWHFA